MILLHKFMKWFWTVAAIAALIERAANNDPETAKLAGIAVLVLLGQAYHCNSAAELEEIKRALDKTKGGASCEAQPRN